MKFLLVLVVVGGVLWLMFGRRGRIGKAPQKPGPAAGPVVMVACAHCGLNLPLTEAPQDADGRPYCGAAHLAAGPR
jgi:uncharacterized protein